MESQRAASVQLDYGLGERNSTKDWKLRQGPTKGARPELQKVEDGRLDEVRSWALCFLIYDVTAHQHKGERGSPLDLHF